MSGSPLKVLKPRLGARVNILYETKKSLQLFRREFLVLAFIQVKSHFTFYILFFLSEDAVSRQWREAVCLSRPRKKI